MSEDDYSYLNDNSTSSEDLPFHTVNWNPEDTQGTSKEKSSVDICTVSCQQAHTRLHTLRSSRLLLLVYRTFRSQSMSDM